MKRTWILGFLLTALNAAVHAQAWRSRDCRARFFPHGLAGCFRHA